MELLYDAIVSAGLRPTTTTHNSVMTAHLEYGTAEGAIEHFPLMQESGAVPDEVPSPSPPCGAFKCPEGAASSLNSRPSLDLAEP